MVRQLMDYMSLPAAGAQVLVGLAALVLGIFGTCRHRVWKLMVLVALLPNGASILLRSSSLDGLLLDFLHI